MVRTDWTHSKELLQEENCQVRQDWMDNMEIPSEMEVNIFYFTNAQNQCSYLEYYKQILFTSKQSTKSFSNHEDIFDSVDNVFIDLIQLYKAASEQVKNMEMTGSNIIDREGNIYIFVLNCDRFFVLFCF